MSPDLEGGNRAIPNSEGSALSLVCGVMFNRLQYLVSLVGVLSMAIAPAVRAEVVSQVHHADDGARYNKPAIADDIGQSQIGVATSTAIAQRPETTIQIIDIQISETDTGLAITLETSDGRLPQSITSGFDTTVVIDLANTQLNLPPDNAVVQENPVAGITSLEVTPLDANSVRITLVGDTQAPTATLAPGNGALVVSIATSEAIADQPPETLPDEDIPSPAVPSAPDEGLRIVVTDEPEASRYLAPETTTGTRTDTSIFEIPQTIQVLPQELLEDQQVIRLDDAILNVPNAIRGNDAGSGSDSFVIRGFENTQVLRDGFRDTGTAGAQQGTEQLANVERIEVLSGPASILYGSVEPGGVINLVTERPLSEFSGEVGLQVGSFELFRPTLDVSGPLTDDGDLLYRLNVSYEYSDGFRDFDTNVERVFVAPVVEWRLGDRTTLIFDLEYLDDRRPFDRGIPAIDDEIADVPLDTLVGELDDFADNESFEVGYRLEHEFSDNWQLRNRFRYSTSDYLTRRAQIGASLGDGNFARAFNSNDSQLETYEVQTELVGEFSTGSIEHTLLLGVDLFFSDISVVTSGDLAPPINVFDPEFGRVDSPDLPLPFITSDRDNELYQVGVILQDQIRVLPNVTVLLGGRLDFVGQQIQGEPIFIPGFVDSPAIDNEQDFSNFSPRVGVVYQPIDPLFLYASYSQSFAPNNPLSVTVEGDLLEPREAEQFEIGVKAELLEGRLAATLAFFDLTERNVAATDPDNIDFVVPIGEQTSRGLELVLQGEILPGWNVVASYGLLDAEIEESEDFPEGATPRNVADNTFSFFTTYEIQDGALEGLGFGLGVFYVDDRFGDGNNTFELDSYWRTDAAVFYRTGNWRLGLNVQNLFDEDYFESGSVPRTGIPGDPFTVLGTISVTF